MTKNIKNSFLNIYSTEPYIIQKKSEHFLTVILLMLFSSIIVLLASIFIDGTVISIIQDSFFILLCGISMYLFSKGNLEKAINIYIFAYLSGIFSNYIIADLLSNKVLTHYRILLIVVALVIGFFIISLVSIKRYQSLIIIYLSCFLTILESFIIYIKYYSNNISGEIISDFVVYFLFIIVCSIILNSILKMNYEVLKIIGKENELLHLSNEALELKVRDRTSEITFANEKLKELVYYDALTKLPNRKKMLEDINKSLNDKNEKFAVLFIDLDHFKSANDNYGHQAGDYILETVATRLKRIINSIDTVSRIGGDEFIIILRNLKDTATSERIAEAALETLSSSFTYKENQLFVGGSIGISIFPNHGIDADTLIKRADQSMYEVKRKGGNGYMIYSQEITEEGLNKLEANSIII